MFGAERIERVPGGIPETYPQCGLGRLYRWRLPRAQNSWSVFSLALFQLDPGTFALLANVLFRIILGEIVFTGFASFDRTGVAPFKIFLRKIIEPALGGTEG